LVLIVSARFWARCTKEQQELLRVAARKAAEFQRGLAVDEQRHALVLMTKAGADVHRIGREAMRHAVSSVYVEFAQVNGWRLIMLARSGGSPVNGRP
jgi:TRAP-type C4-dicarboxylate transport system substrate-binding protein